MSGGGVGSPLSGGGVLPSSGGGLLSEGGGLLSGGGGFKELLVLFEILALAGVFAF